MRGVPSTPMTTRFESNPQAAKMTTIWGLLSRTGLKTLARYTSGYRACNREHSSWQSNAGTAYAIHDGDLIVPRHIGPHWQAQHLFGNGVAHRQLATIVGHCRLSI